MEKRGLVFEKRGFVSYSPQVHIGEVLAVPCIFAYNIHFNNLRSYLAHRGGQEPSLTSVKVHDGYEHKNEYIITCCGTFRSRLLLLFCVFFIAITDNVFVCIDINLILTIPFLYLYITNNNLICFYQFQKYYNL